MSTLTQIIADAYRKMVNPPAPVPAARPKWVPASITEENVTSFVQAVTEARKANESIVEFNGKKYGIKKEETNKEETNKEDDDKAKKIQDMDAEKAPKQPSDEVPAEVKEEDSEEIKVANVADKEKDAEEMQRIAASEAPGDKRAEMAEELVGNQHKLDVNKNGKVDGDDLKKLRGEEKEEDSEEEHPEPDADNMGGPSDNDADNKGEDDDVEEAKDWTGHVPIDWTDHGTLRSDVKSKLHGLVYKAGTTRADWRADHPTNPKHHAAAIARVKAGGGSYRGGDAGYAESTQLTGEQTISSVAATYASMVNENVAGDPHAANLSAKANSATALAHTSHSETHHEDARDAHNLAAEHYRVYAHNHNDPLVRSAANIHHEFHRSMSNHHMLNLVSSDMDKEAHDMAAKHYGKKSVEEGTSAMVNEEDDYSGDNPVDKLHLDVPAFIRVLERAREDFKTDEDIHNFTQQLLAMKSDCIHTEDLPSSPVKEGTAADAEAGPEVMDPVTQKAKDDADDETEIKDGVPGAAQDGGDKVSPADKPAAANSSAALPKVAIVDAPTKLKESALNDDNEELEESVSSSSKVPHSVWGGDEGKKEHSDYMSKHHGVKTTFHRNDKLSYKGSRKALKSALKYHYGVEKFDNLKKDHPKLFKESALNENEGAAGETLSHSAETASKATSKFNSEKSRHADPHGAVKAHVDAAAHHAKAAQHFDAKGNTAKADHHWNSHDLHSSEASGIVDEHPAKSRDSKEFRDAVGELRDHQKNEPSHRETNPDKHPTPSWHPMHGAKVHVPNPERAAAAMAASRKAHGNKFSSGIQKS